MACRQHQLSYDKSSRIFPKIIDFKSQKNTDANNNMNVMNEMNYDYARTNNKGIILPPESLRIDTTPRIESLMIKLKNIDENGNREIIFSRNDGS